MRSVPTSLVFSMTVIISVLAMLNAATKIMSASMTTVSVFSNRSAAKSGACTSIHVRVIGNPSKTENSAASSIRVAA